MLITAYFSGSNIKIGGKVYAFHVEDSQPDNSREDASPSGNHEHNDDPAPDAYVGLGRATARKNWWLMIFAMSICSVNVIGYFDDKDHPWRAVLSAVVGVGIATAFGYALDGSWGYPIARGQYLQFAIIGVITGGVFTVFYLGGYYAGKRWPWRNKRSLEYRAHPRHQKREP